jgi:hypothetical protein
VEEYLVFDPTREWLGTAVRAWHATARGFTTWPAGRDGRWHSRVVPVSFQPEGLLLRVDDDQGVRMLHALEAARRVYEQAQRAEEQARHIAKLEAEIRRLRGE